MPLKIYYDGSRNRESGRDASVTLCGVASTETLWEEIGQRWGATLEKHRVPKSLFHMTDFMAGRGDFTTANGWDKQSKRELLRDLFNVLGHFRMTHTGTPHLVAYSATVLLTDWDGAKEEIPALTSPESICVNYCVGGLHMPAECLNEGRPFHLYFDRNEPFMHKVNRVWERRRKQRGTLFAHIGTIEKVTMEAYPIQIADTLGWIADRLHRGILKRDSMWGIRSVLMIEHRSICYDYPTIIEQYPTGKLKT